MNFSSIPRRIAPAILATFTLGVFLSGCTMTTFDPVLSSTVGGLTLDSIRDIQNDERLTADERRTQIRDAIGAPTTPEGDRLVDFLLNLTLP